MTLARTLRIALTALARNKTRSLLTVLGVIIGVAAVIAMVSIGEGAKARVAETFAGMGTDTLVVSSGSARTGGVRGGAGSQPTLTWADLEALRSQLPAVGRAAPQLRQGAQVASETDNWQTSILGTTPDWFQIRSWPMALGEVFSNRDLSSGRAVAVLGKTVADALFGDGNDPVGERIRIGRVPFVVVAVAASKGSSAFGTDNDDTVIIPATTFTRKLSGSSNIYLAGSILVSAARPGATAEARDEIEALLRERHRLREEQESDFSVRDLAEIAQAQKESAATITSLLAGVALVSLIVGGIGIMNIMLVSVTERTREVGLRMAVGARPRHILAQFLAEAIALSLAGGLLGVAAGLAAARYLAARFEFPLLVRLDITALALATSGLVGIVFGLYPARKAARLDPIQALRQE